LREGPVYLAAGVGYSCSLLAPLMSASGQKPTSRCARARQGGQHQAGL